MKEHNHIDMNMIHILPSFLLTVSTLCFLFTLPQSHSQENGTKFWNCSQPFYFSVPTLFIFNISYPFWDDWDRPRYCGGRNEFKLSISDSMGFPPLIRIDSQDFELMDINITTNTLIIIRPDFIYDDCHKLLINDTFSSPLFCWEVSPTSPTSLSREWFKYLLDYSSYCQLVLRWNLNMVSEPEPNFSPVIMGQKMPFPHGSKVTLRLVRQASVEGACWEVSPTSPTSLSREWFKYLLDYSSHCQLVLRWNLNIFHYTENVYNITVFHYCPGDVSFRNNFTCPNNGNGNQNAFYVQDNELNQFPDHLKCKDHTQLHAMRTYPLKPGVGILPLTEAVRSGFEVNYDTEECKSCRDSKGICGRIETDEYQFCCHCPDGSETSSQCLSHKNQTLTVAVAGNKWNRKRKVILGGVTGAAIVGLFICIIIFYFRYKSSSWPQDIWLTTKSNQHIEEFLKGHGALTLKRYKFSDVKKMTNSFKFKLGQGGFGTVYKGTLPNGCNIAVKILNASKGNGKDFINEVASISRTSHVNVVTLLGFCLRGRKKALIYEFMSNGSLDKFIYQQGPEITAPSLSWDSLYQISLGIAQGLEYLHRGCKTRILHFDIKPHNILLDENFCPKISDFGLAKLCPTKESIISLSDARGTIGYVAPEVWNRHFGGVSHKSDVYSYGMLLLEMVGWRRNINAEASHSSEIYFPDYIYRRLEEGNADGVVATEENEIARKMTVVGLWCLQTVPNDRPTISKVIDMLEGSMNSLEVPPKPVLFSPTRSVPECSITSSSTT